MEETIELSELIRILWKRKWIWILLPIVAAAAAFVGSMMMTPTYEASTTIVIGNFNDNIYTNLDASKQIILSTKMLAPIQEKLGLDFGSTQAFKDSLSVDLNTSAGMITIKARYHDPEIARRIAEEIANAYLEKSHEVYQAKRQLIEEQLATLQKRYEQVTASLERNKEALASIVTNKQLSNVEKDLVYARLLDYVVKDETTLDTLETQMQEIRLQLLDMDEAQLVEAAQTPESPVSPRTTLNTAIAFVVGGLAGVGLAFVMEYFQHHPVRLEEETVGAGNKQGETT